MWIPVITILWALGDNATWVNFPMVNFPFSSRESCNEYVETVRSQVTRSNKYISGYSVCIEVPQGEQT